MQSLRLSALVFLFFGLIKPKRMVKHSHVLRQSSSKKKEIRIKRLRLTKGLKQNLNKGAKIRLITVD